MTIPTIDLDALKARWEWVPNSDEELAEFRAVFALARRAEDAEAELAKVERRRDVAESALSHAGYRRSCDIPACNCGDQWGHGGHANERLREIYEALGDLTNGRTALKAIELLVAELDAALAKLAEAEREIGVVRSQLLAANGRETEREAERDAARAEVARLTTIIEGYFGLGDSHYAHHDPKGTAGANCPACIARREHNALAREALASKGDGK